MPDSVYGLPQFAVRFGSSIYEGHIHEEGSKTMDCRACHINPTGGGMRNLHGRQFSVGKLPMQENTGEINEQLIETAQVNPLVTIGTDIRFAYLHADKASTTAYKDSFFPMQGDIYAAFTPAEHLVIYYQDGIQQNREVFGMINELAANAHVKFGKFIPPYGLKLDDHTSFIRDKLGFGNTFGRDSESGVEAGFANELWFGNAAIFNGSGVEPDDNSAKGFSATGGVKTPQFWLAGSYYNNTTGNASSVVTREYIGTYTAARFQWLAILGEWDWTFIKTSPTKRSGDVAYGELNATISRGVVAKIKYDVYDPDQNSPGDRLERFTFGFDIYPYPFTEVFVQYRKNIEEIDSKNDQILIMTHLFY